MPGELTIKQAARLSGKDEKTVRRWITGKQPRLSKITDRRGRYLIAPSDLERILQEDASSTPAPSLVLGETRLAALEQRLAALEQRLTALEQAARAAPKSVLTITPPRAAESTPAAEPPAVAADDSPDWQAGWVDLPTLLKQHPLAPRSTVIRTLAGHIKKGHWRVNGHAVTNALDEAGQAEFRRLFGASIMQS